MHAQIALHSQVANLGNDDSVDATQATAMFRIEEPGSYKICYKLSSGNYTQVGNSLLTFSATSIPDSSYREALQNVSLSFLPSCYYWTGIDVLTLSPCCAMHALYCYNAKCYTNPLCMVMPEPQHNIILKPYPSKQNSQAPLHFKYLDMQTCSVRSNKGFSDSIICDCNWSL